MSLGPLPPVKFDPAWHRWFGLLKTQFTALVSRVASIEPRIDTLEGNISDLQNAEQAGITIKGSWFVTGSLSVNPNTSRTLVSFDLVQGSPGDILQLPDFETTSVQSLSLIDTTDNEYIFGSQGRGTYLRIDAPTGIAGAKARLKLYQDGVDAGTIATITKIAAGEYSLAYGDLGLGTSYLYELTDSEIHTYSLELEITDGVTKGLEVGAGIVGFAHLIEPPQDI